MELSSNITIILKPDIESKIGIGYDRYTYYLTSVLHKISLKTMLAIM